MLKVIISPGFRNKNMNQNIDKIHGNPFVVAQPYAIHGFFSIPLANIVAYRFCDSFYLLGGVTVTNDEIMANGAIDLRQICNYYAMSLFVLNAFCYGI